MRILELGKYYFPHRGGMETALRQICHGLLQCGHELRVIVSAEGPRTIQEEIEGVVVQRVARWGQWRSLPLNPALLPAMRHQMREFRPELVHLHLPNPAMAAAWLAVGDRQLPLVVSYHSDIVRQRWLGAVLEPLRQRLLRRAATVVVTSRSLLDQSRSLGPHRERCVVVPFGVELPEMGAGGESTVVAEAQAADAPVAESAPAAVDSSAAAGVVFVSRDSPSGDPEVPWPRFFLFVGRMVYYKGLQVLLSALAEEEIPLVVVGDGPLRRSWEALSRKLKMEERVRFLGEVSPRRLDLLYRRCQALVLPSTAPSETFGLVQLEAMARGRPVVAARASGGVVSVQEEDVTGLLVPAGDILALRRALTTLWNDPGRADKMGRAARARVSLHYDARRTTRLMCSVLESAAGSLENGMDSAKRPVRDGEEGGR